MGGGAYREAQGKGDGVGTVAEAGAAAVPSAITAAGDSVVGPVDALAGTVRSPVIIIHAIIIIHARASVAPRILLIDLILLIRRLLRLPRRLLLRPRTSRSRSRRCSGIIIVITVPCGGAPIVVRVVRLIPTALVVPRGLSSLILSPSLSLVIPLIVLSILHDGIPTRQDPRILHIDELELLIQIIRQTSPYVIQDRIPHTPLQSISRREIIERHLYRSLDVDVLGLGDDGPGRAGVDVNVFAVASRGVTRGEIAGGAEDGDSALEVAGCIEGCGCAGHG